jgi:streptogramin lyase
MTTNRTWKLILSTAGAIVLSVVVLSLHRIGTPAEARVVTSSSTNSSDGESFVYQFDSVSETYVFTFTIPIDDANPTDIIVVPDIDHQDVWFTESGADRIGRLTYTDTLDYVYRPYTLTTGTQPLNLVSGEGFVWFTEASRDRIGRLDPETGQIDEFAATAGSYPADLAYDATDHSIWFTEKQTSRIAQLVITTTSDYEITEYTNPLLDGGQPYGIAIMGESIYLAQPANNRLTRFTPPNSWAHFSNLNEPYNLTEDNHGKMWGTERAGNQISQFELGTFPIVVPYVVTPTNSLPTGITADDNDYLWFTQWRAGQIGRLLPGSTPQIDYYPLPLPGLTPTGITTDNSDGIWLLASRPYRVYLPLTLRCWHDSVATCGVQFYSSLNAHDGFHEIADAGARWIRRPLSWESIEPDDTTPDNYNWANLDATVNSAVQREVNLILTLSGQPSWAATYPAGPVTDTADIIEFVGAVVERYDADGTDDAPGSPPVRHFELYNEPDNADVAHAATGGWGYWGHNGSGYAELLQELHPVIKGASPHANLVFGGISLDYFEPGGVFDPQFLDDVLAACQGNDCFDVMNFHYYPYFRSRWEPYDVDIIGKTDYVRQKLAAYGFGGTPVVCTETSWPSNATWGNHELQSRYVIKGYARSKAADLEAWIWYAVRDIDSSHPGLLDNELFPKPSYTAYETMTTMLDKTIYHRPLTLAETGSSQIEGYMFQKACGGRIDVVWTEDSTWFNADDDPLIPMTVQAGTLRVVDKLGNETWAGDGNDGAIDGQITVVVGGSPLYLEYNP